MFIVLVWFWILIYVLFSLSKQAHAVEIRYKLPVLRLIFASVPSIKYLSTNHCQTESIDKISENIIPLLYNYINYKNILLILSNCIYSIIYVME